MGDFLRFILDSIQYLWPFRIVQQHERGVYHICGRRVRIPKRWGGPDCKPGIPWPVVPFFCDIKVVTTVRDTIVTPIQTITTLDGGTLTFSCTVQIEIEDANLAYNAVHDYVETVKEDASSIMAEKLAEVDAERLQVAGRGRLIGACKQSLAAQLSQYGVRILALRMNNFVKDIPVARLFNDQMYTGH